MLLIRPKTIDAAALVASNVAEAPPAAYNSGTTYGLNDQVRADTASAVIADHANTTVTDLGGGVYTVEKTSGATNTWDASAVSSAGMAGDFVLRIKTLSATADGYVCGVTSDPLVDADRSSIDLGWMWFAGFGWYNIENGTTSISALSDVTYSWIWRTGSTVGYGRGVTLAAAQASPDRTVTNGATLYFKSSFATPGEKAEVLLTYAVGGTNPIPLYRSLGAANIGHDPASSPTFWVANGFTYPAYSATAIYTEGVITTANRRLLESLSGTSAAVTMTIASPCVITQTAHGLPAGTPIVFTTTGALPTGLTAGMVYYVLNPTANTFNVAASAGGSAINTSGSQSGTHTATANPNLGKQTTDTAFWLDIGPTNRWAMFDDKVGTPTTDATLIDVTIAPGERIDSLGLVGLENAASVQIIMTAAPDGEVYNHTTELTSVAGITDWYDYFFEEVERRDKFLASDLPPYSNASIQVIVTGTGGENVEVGSLLVGQKFDIGEAQQGSSLGITDYSRKDVDAFGNYEIVERNFADRGTFKTVFADTRIDAVKKVLASRRARGTLFSAHDAYDSTLIWGLPKDWSIEFSQPNEADLSLEIEGLT